MKRLYRSRTDRKIFGICGGIAEYFQIDATFIRIIWMTVVLAAGTGILLYLICLLIMPLETQDRASNKPKASEVSSFNQFYRSTDNKIIAGVCGGMGDFFNIDPLIIRILFLALALVGLGTGIILYIILWIVIPKKS